MKNRLLLFVGFGLIFLIFTLVNINISPIAPSVKSDSSMTSSESMIQSNSISCSSAIDQAPSINSDNLSNSYIDEAIFYGGGSLMGSNAFTLPEVLETSNFRNFFFWLETAVNNPVASIYSLDANEQSVLAYNMLQCFYFNNQDKYTMTQMIETNIDGSIHQLVYTHIPVADFLQFAQTHLGINDPSFFTEALDGAHYSVLLNEDHSEILMIPLMEPPIGIFQHFSASLHKNVLSIYAQSTEGFKLKYNFDISAGMNSYSFLNSEIYE